MKSEDFTEVMQKLIECYGQKAFPAVRMGLIYRTFKILTKKEFSDGVDRIIADSRFAPLLNDFKATLHGELENAYKRQKEENAVNCSICENLGVITMFKKDGPPGLAGYAFRCTCNHGWMNYKGLPIISSRPAGFISVSQHLARYESGLTGEQWREKMKNFGGLKKGDYSI